MRKSKYLILIAGFVANMFLFNLAFASSQTDTVSLNPEYVKDRVLDTDLSLKQKEKAVARAYYNLRKAWASKQAANTQESVSNEAYYNADRAMNMSNLAVNIAQIDYDVAKEKSKLSAEQKYYDVIKLQKRYYIAIENSKVAQENYRVASVKYKVGTIARRELIDADVQLAGANILADQAKRQYEITLFGLKNLLGIEKDETVLLTEPMTYTAYKTININTDLDEIVDESNELMILKEQKDAYQENIDLAKDQDLTGTITYDDAVLTLQESELTYDKTKQDLENAIYAAYVGLQSSADQIKVLNKKQELAWESLRVTRLQYKNGLATNLQVSLALNQYTDILNQRIEAIYTYNINKAKFENKLFL